jgi:pimeloyl-ACP methyl ester carboxylesterase
MMNAANRRAGGTPQWVRRWRLLLIVVVAAAFSACGSGHSGAGAATSPGPGPSAAPGDLVASQPVGSLTVAQLTTALGNIGVVGITLRYDTNCHRLSYKTPDVGGALITASGLVCLPIRSPGTSSPVISYQHGTIFQDPDSPSSFAMNSEAVLGAAFAALGYIAVLPDYVGYGDSTERLHPYVQAATLASATVDMNRAARRFLAQPGMPVTPNGQLFLTGYSEGGYATLATQRRMEQDLASEFPITASEPAAGPYDLSGTVRVVLAGTTQPQPAFTGFMVKAYDSTYNATSQLNYYFTATYASRVDSYFDGSYTGNQISDALGGPGVATATLFNPAFLASYLGAGEPALKAAIAANDIYHWAPAVPTRLFHGADDDIVPYANAVTAKAAMDANGSTTVTLADCYSAGRPTTHDNCIAPYIVDMLVYFDGFATGL